MANSNLRDERGWRVPRVGTKSYQIYHLMVAGFSNREISDLFQEDPIKSSIKVLANAIKAPVKKNEYCRQLYREGRVKKSSHNAGGYSRYVIKLVNILGMSYTEALEEERKALAKEAAK
jgi:hypothetical protein